MCACVCVCGLKHAFTEQTIKDASKHIRQKKNHQKKPPKNKNPKAVQKKTLKPTEEHQNHRKNTPKPTSNHPQLSFLAPPRLELSPYAAKDKAMASASSYGAEGHDVDSSMTNSHVLFFFFLLFLPVHFHRMDGVVLKACFRYLEKNERVSNGGVSFWAFLLNGVFVEVEQSWAFVPLDMNDPKKGN